MNEKYCCPECGSSNVKRLSLIYEQGISDLDGYATGPFITVKGDWGWGVEKVTGSSQTISSQMAAPPEINSPIFMIILTFVIGFINIFGIELFLRGLIRLIPLFEIRLFLAKSVYPLGLLFGMVVPLIFLVNVVLHGRRTYDRKISDWHDTFQCQTCGRKYIVR